MNIWPVAEQHVAYMLYDLVAGYMGGGSFCIGSVCGTAVCAALGVAMCAMVFLMGSGTTTVVIGTFVLVMGLGCVDPWFFLTWSRWPLIIATDGRLYLRRNKADISGREDTNPAFMAFSRLEMAGEPRDACKHAIL